MRALSEVVIKVREMRTVLRLATRPNFAMSAVSCRDDHTHWSAEEARCGHSMVLVRRGRFRRRANGVESTVDNTMAYVAIPDMEERFAHPAGGDECTLVEFSPALWRTLTGDAALVTRSSVYVDAALDLAHRRLLGAREDVDYALCEELLGLLGTALGQVVATVPSQVERRSSDHKLAAAAREAIAMDHPAAAGLFPLAESLAVSPYRLSRVFSREFGVSLTRYRNRVRIGRALDSSSRARSAWLSSPPISASRTRRI